MLWEGTNLSLEPDPTKTSLISIRYKFTRPQARPIPHSPRPTLSLTTRPTNSDLTQHDTAAIARSNDPSYGCEPTQLITAPDGKRPETNLRTPDDCCGRHIHPRAY